MVADGDTYTMLWLTARDNQYDYAVVSITARSGENRKQVDLQKTASHSSHVRIVGSQAFDEDRKLWDYGAPMLGNIGDRIRD